jgi:acetyl esterase
MPVNPVLQPILDKINATPIGENPPISQLRLIVQERHRQMRTLAEEPPAVAQVTNVMVPVHEGEIPVRIYSPFGEGPFPVHIYFHTGGFCLGTLDQCDGWCRELCVGAGCIVISVDYRLAPEYPFPTATEDSYASLCWAFEHHAEFGIDPSRISVGGASAGGNLATVVALMARDRKGPQPIFQLLELPTTDLTMSQPSIEQYGEGYLPTRKALREIHDFYLSDPQQVTHPYVSPLLAPDLSGLPPTLIMTAEFDPLRDEGEAYGQRLKEAGVPTTIKRWEGLIHTSEQMSKILPAARQFREMAINALRQAYIKSTPN